jgi:hypothetical protein
MNNSGELYSQESMRKSNLLGWLAGALILLLLMAPLGIYGWRYLYNPCEVEAVEQASGFLNIQLKTYDGVYQVATTASRDAPDHPVIVLQQILMDTQEVAVPTCLQTAKSELVNYMGTVILAFQSYRSGEADAKIFQLVRQSDEQYGNFKAELKTIKKCAPYCFP